MATTAGTFSSARMRDRDRLVEEKHQKDLSALQAQVNRLRYSNDDLRKQYYDVDARASRLANALGFQDFVDAQVFISTADHEISYKDCFERVGFLESELEAAVSEVESLKETLSIADKEREELKAKLDASRERELETRKSSDVEIAKLKLELSSLRERFEDLRDSYEHAADTYKDDYKKWREFNAWLSTNDGKDKKAGGSQKKQHCATVMRNKRKLQDMLDGKGKVGLTTGDKDGPPPLGGIVNPLREVDVKPPSSGTLIKAESQPKPLGDSQKVNKAGMPLRSPSVFLLPSDTASKRGSLTFKPVPTPLVQGIQQPNPTPSRAGPGKKDSKKEADEVVFPSSETEDDTQDLQLSPTFKIPEVPKTLCSSETEEDTASAESPAVKPNDSLPTPKSPARTLRALPASKVPDVPRVPCSSETEEDTAYASSPLPQHDKLTLPLRTPESLARPSGIRRGTDDADTHGSGEPPRKIQRIDSMLSPQHSPFTNSTKSGARRRPYGKQQVDRRGTSNRGGKDKENFIAKPSPMQPNGIEPITPLQDYSVFKGRGRYAKGTASASKTINGSYAIDPSRNGGMQQPYDEVVRRKEARKKMNAGDCECCRDYYEAVGPLPPLVQPPLWRSPPKTEVKKRAPSCKMHKRHASDSVALDTFSSTFSFKNSYAHDHLQDESQFGTDADITRHRQIEDHKKAISRHRHHWARATTPPGYWDIGFPDTQQAEKINKEAEEMHRKKQAVVELSVNRGEGRYRRR